MNKQDDEQWLAALAGKPDPSADTATNAQANALRSAMLARREQLERDAQLADASELERLRSRLKHEGLLHDNAIPNQRSKNRGGMARIFNWLQSKADGSFALSAWSLTVNIALAIVVAFQLVSPGASSLEDENVLRSSQMAVLRVSDPEARLAELIDGIEKIESRYVVKRVATGDFELIIQANVDAMFYLSEQRINAVVVNNLITIKIEKIEK